jgi:putative aldouronate transport system substrate-binding protein
MKTITRRELLRNTVLGAAGALLAGCAQAAPTSKPQPAAVPQATQEPAKPTAVPPTAAPAKPVKITLVESWFGVPQFKESIDPVNAEISKKMQSEGLNVEIQSMILENHSDKYPLLYASGADFTMAFDAPWYKMTGLLDQGALLAIDDLVKQFGPNIVEKVTPEIMDFNYMNGHLCGIPTAFYYSGTCGVVWREDLRRKYNVPAPTSADGWKSLEPFLDAIKKNEPSLIPLAFHPTYSPTTTNICLRHGWNPGDPPKLGLIIPDILADTKYMNIEDIPEYIQGAELLRSWWEKGYVPKADLAFATESEGSDKTYFIPGKCAAYMENEPDFKFYDVEKQLKKAFPDAEAMGCDLTGMRAGKVKGIGQRRQWNFIVFNAGAPQQEQQAGIQFFNWLMGSQDNLDMWWFGVDGVNYKKEPDSRYSDIEGVDQTRNYRREWYVSGCPGRFRRLDIALPKAAEDAIKFFSGPENWVFNPYEAYAPDTKPLETQLASIQAVYNEAMHGLDTGQTTVADGKATATRMLDDAGRLEVRAALQKQFDDWRAANT